MNKYIKLKKAFNRGRYDRRLDKKMSNYYRMTFFSSLSKYRRYREYMRGWYYDGWDILDKMFIKANNITIQGTFKTIREKPVSSCLRNPFIRNGRGWF